MKKQCGVGKTALVTGASSGIGMEMAKLLAADGYSLILAARRVEKLDALCAQLGKSHGVSVQAVPIDLSDADAAATLWSRATAIAPAIDVLVNNAGVGISGPCAESDFDDLSDMVNLNVLCLTQLTRLALPGMVERKQGRILNLASLAAYQPGGPDMAAYYATKSYVLSFTRGLNRELCGSGVRVTALCPGPTATEFEQASGAGKQRLFHWFKPMRADKVARAGYRGMRCGISSVVPGIMNKLLAFGGELPPRQIALEINRLLLQKVT